MANPFVDLGLAGAFLTESDAKKCINDYQAEMVDYVIVNRMVPCDWDSSYVSFSMDDMIMSTNRIDSCCNNYNQVLASWENSLKGKKDSLGAPFGPSSDVSYQNSNDEREFVNEYFNRLYLLKISKLDKALFQ